jgi:hypothetical protein
VGAATPLSLHRLADDPGNRGSIGTLVSYMYEALGVVRAEELGEQLDAASLGDIFDI